MYTRLTTILALAVGVSLLTASAAFASSTVIYSSAPNTLAPNYPSLGLEATAAGHVGDAVDFAGSARKIKTVKVILSTWACQSGTWNGGDCFTNAGAKFSVPITLDIYHAGVVQPDGSVTPGNIIASVTKTFQVPFRPSASPKCKNGQVGEWFKNGQGCFNGKAVKISFPLGNLHSTLPDSIVYTVGYNTTHYGDDPIGESASCFGTTAGCPYDSLNVALTDSATVGNQTYSDSIFWDTAFAGNSCGSPFVTGEINRDTGCWAGYVPAAQFLAAN